MRGSPSSRYRRRHTGLLALCLTVLIVIAPRRAAATCSGDCDNDRVVGAAELVRAIQIYAGDAALKTCSSIDTDGDEAVSEAELVEAIHHVFDACAAAPLAVDASEVCFTGLVGTAVAPQTVIVERASGTWTAEAGAAWLSLNPSSGQAGAGLELRVNTSALSDGSYEATVTISDEAMQNVVSLRAALTLSSASAAAGWTVQKVEPVGSAVNGTSLALDPDGRPGITFYRADQVVDRQLRYAHWTGCRWRGESVERLSFDPSLAFDKLGGPHISFVKGVPEVLRYAAKKGPLWDVITVEDQGEGGATGHRSSLALDADDHPHISYLLKFVTGHIFTYDLRYAWFDGGTWSLETVDSQGGTGWDTSIALTPDGAPRISSFNDSRNRVRYAEWLSDHWNIEDADIGGSPSSLRLDSEGRPLIAHHVTYTPTRPRPLRFTFRDESGWHAETVDDDQGVTVGTRAGVSLALDASDTPHIAYVDFIEGALKYSSLTAGGWQTKVIDSGPMLGDHCSLEIDQARGVAHVSYLDQTAGTLKYASGPAAD